MVQCCDITAASLTALITLERQTRVSDGMGGWTELWVADPIGGVWASVKDGSGTERLEADRPESHNLFTFIIRFRGDDSGAPYWNASTSRISFRGRFFNPLSIIDIEMKQKWLRILAREGEPA